METPAAPLTPPQGTDVVVGVKLEVEEGAVEGKLDFAAACGGEALRMPRDLREDMESRVVDGLLALTAGAGLDMRVSALDASVAIASCWWHPLRS